MYILVYIGSSSIDVTNTKMKMLEYTQLEEIQLLTKTSKSFSAFPSVY